jgi:hypothetical protein
MLFIVCVVCWYSIYTDLWHEPELYGMQMLDLSLMYCLVVAL